MKDGESACAGEASVEGRVARRPPVSYVSASGGDARAGDRIRSKQGGVSLAGTWMCFAVLYCPGNTSWAQLCRPRLHLSYTRFETLIMVCVCWKEVIDLPNMWEKYHHKLFNGISDELIKYVPRVGLMLWLGCGEPALVTKLAILQH